MKKILLSIILAFSPIMVVNVETQVITEVHAASVKLSKTKVSLKKGKTVTIKVLNNKKKVKWSSSKKSVATVNSKGKVTAKSKGIAYISAKVGTKTYKCKVTVSDTSSKTTSYVYLTATGTKYHKYEKCGNTKTSWKCSLTDAKKQGYEPCKKCF